VTTAAVSFGVTRSKARSVAVAVLAGAVALAFVVWPLAIAAAAVSAFAVYAVSSAVRGARQTFGPGGTTSRSGQSARDRRRVPSQSVARGGRFR